MEFVERVSVYVKRAMKYVHLLPKILEVYQKDAEYMQKTLPTGEPLKNTLLSTRNTEEDKRNNSVVKNEIKKIELPIKDDIENKKLVDNSKPLFPKSTPIKPPPLAQLSMNNSSSYPTTLPIHPNTNTNSNSNNNSDLNDNPSVKTLFTSKYKRGTQSEDLLFIKPITPQSSNASLHSMSSFSRREVSSMSPLPYSPQVKVKKILETPSNSQKKLALYKSNSNSKNLLSGVFSPIIPSTRKTETKIFDYDDEDVQRMKSPLLSPDSDLSPNNSPEEENKVQYNPRIRPLNFTAKKEEIKQHHQQQQNQQQKLPQQQQQQRQKQNTFTKDSKRPPPLKIEENKSIDIPVIKKEIYDTCTPKELLEMENLLLADQYYWMANYFYLLSETMIDGDEDVLKYFQFHLPELQWQWKFMDYIPSRLKNKNEFTSLIYNSLKKVYNYYYIYK